MEFFLKNYLKIGIGIWKNLQLSHTSTKKIKNG
jgi:hypothetical protein